jgi:tripartite-type tricarboxylate transporter receptor subunit TctC
MRLGLAWQHKVPVIVLGALASGSGLAQTTAATFPERPVRLIDPYAPGGGSGVLARILSERLSPLWGKQIVVDNRPGAAGALGTEMAMRAAPDGHTLVMGTSGSIAINPSIYPKLPYNPVRDLVAITQTSEQVSALALHPAVPSRESSISRRQPTAAPAISPANSSISSPRWIPGTYPTRAAARRPSR